MPFRVQCSAGHVLMIPAKLVGNMLNCPKCGVEIILSAEVKTAEDAPLQTTNVSTPDSVLATANPSVPAVAVPEMDSLTQQVVPSTPIALQSAGPPDIAPVTRLLAGATDVAGWYPDADRIAAATHLGLLVMAVAGFSMSPAIWEWLAISQLAKAVPIPPWVYATLLTGCILFCYGVFLAQLPDWSALWVTTAALLITATFYAALLASTLLGNSESSLVVLLRYGDKLAGNRAAMWCFIMLCLSSVTAYFLGHQAVRWYNAYRLLLQFQQRVNR